MRIVLFFTFLLTCLHLQAQQSPVKGLISIHNSETKTGKRKFVNGAEVRDNFGKAQVSVSNGLGQFELVYVDVPEKTSVSFNIHNYISLGLEVVNIDALHAIAGQADSVKISMALPGEIAEYRRQIYEVGKTEAEKKFEALIKNKNNELADLKKNSIQNANKIKKLEQDLLTIEDQKKEIAKNAEDLATKYAPLNLDDTSPFFRSAFGMFQRGALDSALIILTNLDLASLVSKILLEREKLQKLKIEVIKRDAAQEQITHDVGEALEFKANLHKTQLEIDSATVCFELLIKLDSNNVSYLLDYANFLHWINQHDKSINNYLKALEICNRQFKGDTVTYEPFIARAKSNIGILYLEKNDFVSARASFTQALEIRKRLAGKNPQTFNPLVANTLNNLGKFYTITRDLDSAGYVYQRALEIRKSLAVDNSQIQEPEIAKILNNLGAIYTSKNNIDKADSAYTEALRITRRIAMLHPGFHDAEIATILDNQGLLYGRRSEFERAKAAFLESLSIKNRLVRVSPAIYEPELAVTQNNLGVLYLALKDPGSAEAAFLKALEIRIRLVERHPEIYNQYVAQTSNNLGSLYSDKQDYPGAVFYYRKALEIRRQMALSNPVYFEPMVATILSNLGALYISKKDLDSAKISYEEALTIYKHQPLPQGKSYESNIGQIQSILGNLYSFQKDYSRAKTAYLEALQIFKVLAVANPQTYKMVETEIENKIKQLPK